MDLNFFTILSKLIFSNIKLTDYPKFEKFVTTIKKTDDLETVKQSNNTRTAFLKSMIVQQTYELNWIKQKF